MFQERRLHWVYLIAPRQTLYGCDLLAIMRYGQREATVNAASIGQNRTRAALAVIATFLSAGELELLAQKVKQRGAWIKRELLRLSIHCELQRNGSSFRCGLLDFNYRASTANGKAHDRASGKKAGCGNKLTPTYGPSINRALRLYLLIYSLGLWGFVIHLCLLASGKSAIDSNRN
jgi:hypothetical protein